MSCTWRVQDTSDEAILRYKRQMAVPYDYDFLEWWFVNTRTKVASDLEDGYTKETGLPHPYQVYTLRQFEQECARELFDEELLRRLHKAEELESDLDELLMSHLDYWYPGSYDRIATADKDKMYIPFVLAACWSRKLCLPNKMELVYGTRNWEQMDAMGIKQTWIGAILPGKEYDIIQVDGQYTYDDMLVLPRKPSDDIPNSIVAFNYPNELLRKYSTRLHYGGAIEYLLERDYVFGSFLFSSREEAKETQDCRLGRI